MLTGLGCGLLLDSFSGGVLGYYTLIFIYIGYFNGIFTRVLAHDMVVMPVLLCSANELIYSVYIYVFSFLLFGRVNIADYIKNLALPELLMTAIATIIVYGVIMTVDRHLTEAEKKEKRDLLKEYWDLFREWVKNTLRSRIFWLGIVCTLFLAVLVVRLFQLQILDGAAYYDSYVSRTKKEITTTATRGTIYDRNGVVLAGNEAVYNLTVKDTSEYTKANGDFNEMLLRLIEIVKKYDGTIVTELPVIIDDDGQFVYSGKDSAIRQLIRDVYGTSYIEEKSKEGEDVYTYDAETVMKRLMKVSYNFTTRWRMPKRSARKMHWQSAIYDMLCV